MEHGSRSFAGPLFFAAFALLFFGIAYAIWPAEFSSLPLSELSGGVLLRAAASAVLAFVGLEFLGACVIATLTDG
jgi:hypothetical protein